MEILNCPKCLEPPSKVAGESIYCCGILAKNTRQWNNYVYAVRLALTVTYSRYTQTPISAEEITESWAGFDATYKESE